MVYDVNYGTRKGLAIFPPSPQEDAILLIGNQQRFAVWGEGHCSHSARMSLQSVKLLVSGDLKKIVLINGWKLELNKPFILKGFALVNVRSTQP